MTMGVREKKSDATINYFEMGEREGERCRRRVGKSDATTTAIINILRMVVNVREG